MEGGSLPDDKSVIIAGDIIENAIHHKETSNSVVDTTPPDNVRGAKEKNKGEPRKDAFKIRRKRKYRKKRTDMARNSKKEKEDGREIVPPPLNTTQFLMSDYNYNKFSPDVKVDDYNRDNAVDFLLQEFSKEYENTNSQEQKRLEMRSRARCDRMATLSRDDLIHKYMQMDNEVKMLEMRLVMVQEDEDRKAREGRVEYDWRKGEVHMEPETAQKIQVFQNEIAKLDSENKGLVEINSSRQINSSEGATGDNVDAEGEGSGWTSDSSSDSNSSSSDGSSSGGESDSDSESNTSDEVQSITSNTCDEKLNIIDEGTGDDANDVKEANTTSDINECDLVNGVEESATDGFTGNAENAVNGIEDE